ncbi:MAG: hypothetical protein JW809_03110 [Pirellulales bacterium]|nr:hypothetical protein [Pirellulales bacterium]
MNRLGVWLGKARLLMVALACWLSWAAPAWAAKTNEAPKDTGSTQVTPWVLPYALVILGIALGMLVVCRSSRRSDRAKPKAYESQTKK